MTGRARANLAVAVAAAGAWVLIALVTGRIGVHDGLGFSGAGFAGMIHDFTLKGGDEATRVSPLLPALAWLPYTLTGSVAASLIVVDAAAMAVLVFAACLLLDERGGRLPWKALVACSLCASIAFGKLAAFVPGDASLVALAALMLAVAVRVPGQPLLAAGANVAAVMALPVGLVAPVYGVVRARRLRLDASRAALVYLPSLLMWVFVQWWARGGVAGALADFSPRELLGSTGVWAEPMFLPFAAYFFATAAGGLSLVALAHPGSGLALVRRAPEYVVLAGGVFAYAWVVGSAAPLAFGFLAPVWVLLCGEWSQSLAPRRVWWWIAAAVALTLVTQRPFAGVDLTSYFVDWHPYDVYRGSVPVHDDQLWERWVPRFLVVAAAVWAMALAAGRTANQAPVAPQDRVPGPTEEPARLDAPVARAREAWLVPVGTARVWTLAAYGFVVLVTALTGYFLFQIPIQLSDSLGNLLQVQDATLGHLVAEQFNGQGYLRPALWAGLKIVFDLASGHYFAWFRTVHVVLLFGVLAAVVAALRVRTAVDCAAVLPTIAAVLGLHTFAGTIREAFPINTFLVVALLFVATIALARARHRPWLDLVPALLLTYAALAVETGLLVWVACVAAYIVGFRGVSRRGIYLATALVAAYFVLRFGVFHVGAPGLSERSTGFGFSRLEPAALVARFGRNPYPLYAYNVLSGMSTVLVGDPRGGVWQFFAGLATGGLEPWVAINVLTCVLTTTLIGAYIVGRRRAWIAWDLTDGDRLVMIFLAVLPANAVISYAYVKDVVMSPAGLCYALAAFVAIRDVLTVAPGATARRGWIVAVLCAASVGWSIRLAGIEYNLREASASVRTEWAFLYEWEAANHAPIRTPDEMALAQQLYDDAIWRRPAPRALALRWPERVFDKTQ